MLPSDVERLFAGQIGEEYEMLKLICPAVVTMSAQVGAYVATLPSQAAPLRALEIGCGTGMTSLALLNSRDDVHIVAVDNEPAMLRQAEHNLAPWLAAGRIELREADALSALSEFPDGSFDLVASGYAVHNFLEGYRRQVLAEVWRVLKPGGVFVNGDRYRLDDSLAHLQLIQDEVRHYFRTFGALQRHDLLEKWVVHLFSDESVDHAMTLTPACDYLRQLGFTPVTVHQRDGVNTLLTAHRPAE